MAKHSVLVYGTLRPGLNKEVVIIKGQMRSLGGFPGISLVGDEDIMCERITDISDERLARLDMLEGYRENNPQGSMYIRQKYADSDDWIYVYNSSMSGLNLVPNGDWLTYAKTPVGTNSSLLTRELQEHAY